MSHSLISETCSLAMQFYTILQVSPRSKLMRSDIQWWTATNYIYSSSDHICPPEFCIFFFFFTSHKLNK